MKVSIIVQARFHAFNMASYFQEKGILNELITGYPRYIARRFGVNTRKVKPVYINEVINRATYFFFKSQSLNYVANEIFDWIASKITRMDSDVYFIWSGCGLRTIRTIRKKNPSAKIVLVRCSGHIEVQAALLAMVSNKQVVDKRTIQKELEEYKEADFITLPSTFAMNTFESKKITAAKLFLNRYGVNLKEFPFYPKQNDEREELVIGYVGALSKRKNVMGIISVVDQLNKNGKKVRLILAGMVDYQSFDPAVLEQYTFIDYRGRLKQSDLHKIYAEMDVFVINSIEEGLAYVQMQAMSCGLPIISTTNAGGLDLVVDGKNGFTIPILDENALYDKINWFYENRDKIPGMGLHSRQMTENGFSWDDFGQRNITFIQKIANHS